MEYNFQDIEARWKTYWAEQQIYKTTNDGSRPKFYVLDMFPYPSGAGLHVGHPLGYIASDIFARYKRMQGYNVLHPMGYDAFGLPAEQYAIETGQHPATTTEQNIARYRAQLDNIGFSYDWSRSFKTSDPSYYKWTQWIFEQLFHAYYDRKKDRAQPIDGLVKMFEKEGNTNAPAPTDEGLCFSKEQWRGYTLAEQRNILMKYRLAYLDYAEVWWCEALGTVLANDEVVNGVSERGGHPVIRKKMRQWALRITEYAERLLRGLEGLDWTEAMKDMQRNWIGKSQGAEITFDIKDSREQITVFTTRPDTIFGVNFMVLAPEHPLVGQITAPDYVTGVAEYKLYVQKRSERDRMAETKHITGAFTGAYAVHPFTRKSVPIWISEYVLAGYGTGAIMAVPSGDDRDFAFAKHFNIPITNIFGPLFSGDAAYTAKGGVIEGSDFLSGLEVTKASEAAIRAVEDAGIGRRRINYKLRDAGFSRQRYWGEPFPVIYHNEIPYTVDEPALPLGDADRMLPVELPQVEKYGAGPEGQGPLANLEDWVQTDAGRRETNTMPGYAGSSWYFLRYMDPHNDEEFAGREATDYWQQVDVYVGGTEHAVGHLLYARMWTKVLADLGLIAFDEPFKKLVNQGMIQGKSKFVFRGDKRPDIYIPLDRVDDDEISQEEMQEMVSLGLKSLDDLGFVSGHHVDISLVESDDSLNIPAFKSWREENRNANFILLNKGKYRCESETEKMSKRYYNVVNPDDIVAQYGADTFRMYEMFLGPIEVSKPWDTKGIEGVHRFLKKLWRLYYYGDAGFAVTEDVPTEAQLRILHKTIKKVGEDIERFSFNTAVSALMICVNELTTLNTKSRTVLEGLAVIIAPLAPHLAEELWHAFGHESSVVTVPYPMYEDRYVQENVVKYPIAVNGKTRAELEFPADASQAEVERAVMADETVMKWLEGKTPKKVIFVKGRMVNVVV